MLKGRCSFDRVSHTYRIGEWVVPGITEILKVAGKIDTTWIPESARVRGELVHKLTERHDLKFEDISKHVGPLRGWCLSYVDFVAQDKPRFDGIERAVYHAGLGFATIIDRWGSRRGPNVMNIKSGTFNHSHEIQSAGELLALDGRWSDRKRETLYIRDGRSFRVEEHRNDADRDEFLDCLHVWRSGCHDAKLHGPQKSLSDLSRRASLRYA